MQRADDNEIRGRTAEPEGRRGGRSGSKNTNKLGMLFSINKMASGSVDPTHKDCDT
jgi:hypothetical protein